MSTTLYADKHYCVPGKHWYRCPHGTECKLKSQIPCEEHK